MSIFGFGSIILSAVITLILVVNNGKFGCAFRQK